MRRLVEARARTLGFCGLRVTRPDRLPDLPGRLSAWLAEGAQGTMDWMAERADQRASPIALWPGVRSILVLAMSYRPEHDPLDLVGRRDRGAVAAYAQRRDYHEVLKGRLKELGGYLSAKGDVRVKVFCDTAPVMEKTLAEAAGLGWQGKHTVLISRGHGNWLLLGAIYTSAEFEPDAPERDHCGSCRACLDVCPTDAFPAPYRLDARRCISYLTIEHAGPIPAAFRAAIGNRVFGCDDCLAVCPWNKFARTAAESRLAARAELASPALADLAELDDAAFRAFFAGTPVKRTGRDRFLRNVMIAIGNSGDPSLAEAAVARLRDPSPLVRGMAVWACGRLLEPETVRALRRQQGERETDAHVRDEWRAATGLTGSRTDETSAA
ncbi:MULTISPECIES: tRNA epoxyqueuosine(34) reductase QueG [Methylobacterium]|uniref:tRNA epoxyqueuosine(34) reductase QueG n=1 Tax=Methylobacterium TaxID=407 RepID=UPI000F9CE092|nr:MULTISPECIES: tRNA epoxyqueuosine(34) reductase QueG [unclassified Methylobacterium]MCX7333015.1 tRNA epoxyqueuosine(34) reductase QueG [Hyphomicrobiales bacterium]RUP22190.1 MAG: tRNA epoxyqueuosine(34) reductase QueG [Methylobacterium sp.]